VDVAIREKPYGMPMTQIPSVTAPLSETDRFCDSHPYPAQEYSARVQNSCPKSTSHNHRCQTVVRRSRHGTPARLCPRLHHRPATTAPGRRPPAAGCYRVFTETASGARTDRSTLEQVWTQLRLGDTPVVW
jgi:hypothetical protein